MTDIVERLKTTDPWESQQEAIRVMEEAATEIEMLRTEVKILASRVGKLEAECFSLAAWQCEFTDGKTGLVASEGGSTYCAMAREVEALKADLDTFMKIANAEAAEAERLRAALETISDMTDYGTGTATWCMTSTIHNANVIARDALTATPAPKKEDE